MDLNLLILKSINLININLHLYNFIIKISYINKNKPKAHSKLIY